MGTQRKAPFAHGLMADNHAIAKHGAEMVEAFDIRPHDPEYLAGGLSGGNQQKVILAREVSRDPKVMLAIQPTRGLDIGAIEFVRSKLVEERAKDKAVLLISTDLDEILSLSDRILVMHGGRVMGEVSPDVDVSILGLMMAGKSEEDLKAEQHAAAGGGVQG